MLRRAALWTVLLAAVPAAARADNWARECFDSLEHDFGAVQRGTRPEHRFVIQNTTNNVLRIRRVGVSCGCVQATESTREISPGETGTIHAAMDTSGFQGSKSVTIFVQFDRPRRVEVALRVHCVSSGNIASSTNEVDLGVVPIGAVTEKRIHLDYAGEPGWKLVEMVNANPHLHADLRETLRDGERVRYDLRVLLKESAPAGPFEGHVRLKTNNKLAPEVLVVVKANVQGSIVVSPPAIRLESVQAGAQVTKSLIIRAQSPFRILRVENTRGMFQVRSAPTPKTTQLVVVTLTVPQDPETLPDQIELVTDLHENQVIVVPVERQ